MLNLLDDLCLSRTGKSIEALRAPRLQRHKRAHTHREQPLRSPDALSFIRWFDNSMPQEFGCITHVNVRPPTPDSRKVSIRSESVLLFHMLPIDT